MTKAVGTEQGVKPEAGFTLLEVLLSLVLVSLLLTAIPPALRLTKNVFKVTAKIDRDSTFTASLSFLERRLAQAMPIYQHSPDGLLAIVFSGEPRAVKFVAPMISQDEPGGLFLFSLSPIETPDGRDQLALTWQPFRSNADHRDAPQQQRQRILLPDATGFTLSYFGVPETSKEAQWNESWTRKNALPTVVKLTYNSPGARSEVRSRRIELHLQTQQ
ncbi:prepilin-type N-terminal cleavage/methylation domain-containing protein [Hyphomicrobium sp. 99]|uniref:prepilin-type N-terminal cleavage/methylation domain-containing protein n=1 Tax=Hyphomicrobium sp. 99 TaxID=1163419 RepID=UPI0005F84D81|nr:prepilin-type N-terminal cleavage/methylation domain-containing protein [Hyphomicrobium sp. 99]